jgi:DNA ligase 1
MNIAGIEIKQEPTYSIDEIMESFQATELFSKVIEAVGSSFMPPTLYAKSKKGKIKSWKISVMLQQDDTAKTYTVHGYIDGKKQTDIKHVTTGKNIGKSNETTPFEQAVRDAGSAWNKKKDKNYRESIEDIPEDHEGYFLPMLAQSYSKHVKKISYPAYVQPKLDGIRALGNWKGELWSRAGKLLTVPTHIHEQLRDLLDEGECVDGELYVHGWSFQRITAAVKKEREDTTLLEYHIYDRPCLELGFGERFVAWNSKLHFKDPANPTPAILPVRTIHIENHKRLDAIESVFIEQGYEGAIIRNSDGPYVFGHRSYDLQKIKRFQDAEFEIIDTLDGKGREDKAIMFKCKINDEQTFDVRPALPYGLRRRMWKKRDKYVGKLLTVKFFEYTDDGVPRFPVGLHLREEWDL